MLHVGSASLHKLDTVVVLAASLMDVGWVLKMPLLGFAALLVSFCVQSCVVSSSFAAGGLHRAHSLALLCWIVGVAFWMGGELEWDDGAPAGFLSNVWILADINPWWYGFVVGTSSLTLWVTFGALALFYYLRYPVHCKYPQQTVGARKLAVLSVSPTYSASVRSSPSMSDASEAAELHSEAWTVPWLLMEACWTVCNFQMIRKQLSAQWFWLGITAGMVAIFLCVDTLAGMRAREEYQLLTLRFAELFWLLGNVVWLLNDIITGDEALLGRAAAVGLFIIGIGCACAGLVLKGDEAKEEREHLLADVRDRRMLS